MELCWIAESYRLKCTSRSYRLAQSTESCYLFFISLLNLIESFCLTPSLCTCFYFRLGTLIQKILQDTHLKHWSSKNRYDKILACYLCRIVNNEGICNNWSDSCNEDIPVSEDKFPVLDIVSANDDGDCGVDREIMTMTIYCFCCEFQVPSSPFTSLTWLLTYLDGRCSILYVIYGELHKFLNHTRSYLAHSNAQVV